jgi:FixJ family two-component response regulator
MQPVPHGVSTNSAPNTHPGYAFSAARGTHRDEPAREVIYLVDDDANFREEISAYLKNLQLNVIVFPSGTAYLESASKDTEGCFILSIHLPDISGLELQRRLVEKTNPPIIFVSDQCDIASTVCAMKAGAVEFLTKPVDLVALRKAIQTAFTRNRRSQQRRAERNTLQERLSLLTPREREVLPLIVGGLLNKQAAFVLGISEVTLQIHRTQAMRKMQANSFAELVRMAVKLRIPIGEKLCPSQVQIA